MAGPSGTQKLTPHKITDILMNSDDVDDNSSVTSNVGDSECISSDLDENSEPTALTEMHLL